MRLPRNILSQGYQKPRIFLCETDKTPITPLETTETKGSFKFNAYSELTFNVGRTYNDMLTGEQRTNPYYDLIEAMRLIYLEGFGYFEIQGPELSSDGIKEFKNITAYSLEYILSQKYISNFHVNTGEDDSIEVIFQEDNNSSSVVPVVLYDEYQPELSLLHLALRNAYGWKIGYVDPSLAKLSRTFDVDM